MNSKQTNIFSADSKSVIHVPLIQNTSYRNKISVDFKGLRDFIKQSQYGFKENLKSLNRRQSQVEGTE